VSYVDVVDLLVDPVVENTVLNVDVVLNAETNAVTNVDVVDLLVLILVSNVVVLTVSVLYAVVVLTDFATPDVSLEVP
jgi:hypothetical protein